MLRGTGCNSAKTRGEGAAERGGIGLSQSCSGDPGSLWIWNPNGRASLPLRRWCEELGHSDSHPLLPPARRPAQWLRSLETASLKGTGGGKEYFSFRYPKSDPSSWRLSSVSPFKYAPFFFSSFLPSFMWISFLCLLVCFSYSISPSSLVGGLYPLFLLFSVCPWNFNMYT